MFKLAVVKFKLETDVFTLADVKFKLVTDIVFADAVLIKEPVIVATAVN